MTVIYLINHSTIQRGLTSMKFEPDFSSFLICSRLKMDLHNFCKISDTFVYGVVNISGQKLTVVIDIDGRCKWCFGHQGIDHDVEINPLTG